MRTRYLVPFVCWLSLAVVGLSSCGPGQDDSQGQQCSTTTDCEEGQKCRAGRCMQGCESDDDCGGDRSCQLGGICVATCEGDGDCGSGRTCDEDAGVCWPKGEKLETCEKGDDTDCDPDEYCAGDICLPKDCENDKQCAGDNICDEDGTGCRSGCREDGDCSGEEEICDDSNTCVVAGCAGPTIDCGEHQKCNEEVSPSQCEFTGTCDSKDDDDICQGYAEQKDAEIPWICDPDKGECVKKPPCESYEDCDLDEICNKDPDDRNTCVDGCLCTDREECDRPCGPQEFCTPKQKCKKGCETNDDCATEDGDVCVGNVCRESCSSASECEQDGQDGLVCRETEGERICQECSRDNQCPATEECREELGESKDDETGLCRPLPPDCPTDGYGDNHEQQNAYKISKSEIPFKATGGMNKSKPVICRNPASNQNYTGDNGDWWKFDAGQAADPRVIDVKIEYVQEDVGNLDLALVRSDGTQIVSSIRPPGEDGGTERIVYGVRAADTFFVHVTQALQRGVTSAEYKLTVDVRPPKMCGMDGKEENDSRADASPFQPNTAGSFTVCGDDKDFYTLDANANHNVTVTATNAPKRLGDIDLRLIDPETGQTKLVRQDAKGTLELKYSTQDASKLVLEVRLAGGAPGWVDYGLEWTQSPNKCDDQFEPNDTCPGTAHQLQRVTSSTKTFQNLSVCNDDDFYAIDLFPRDTIRVESVYDTTDGIELLTLFGPNSCTTKKGSLQTKSLSGSKQKLFVEYDVPDTGGGTYYIKIEKDQGPGHIPHNMSVDITPGPGCVDDSLEDNDSQSAPTQLSRSNITQGGADSFFVDKKICNADEDWYCLDAQDQDDLAWDVEFTHSAGDLDAFIIGPNGNQQASSTTDTDNESVSYTTQQAGQHCLKVAGDGPTRNSYDQFGTVNGQPSSSCPDIYEDNDSCSSSTSCSAASPTVGSTDKLLVCSGDVDWYETCVQAGETLTVNAEFKHNEGDVDLKIYEEGDVSSRTTVPGTDGTSSNNDETVSVTSSKDQCYYYEASLQSKSRNDYKMTAQTSGPPPCPDDADEDNDGSSNATQAQAPGLVVDRFKCESDGDWYKFDLNSGQKFEAFVNHEHDLGDIDIEVFEQGDLTNPIGSGTSTDDDESVTVSSPSSGTHYVRVFAKDQSRLPYDLLLYQDLDGNGTFEDDEGPEDRTCPDQFENNDSDTEAADVGVGTSSNLLMCVPDSTTGADDDWYQIWVPKEAEIVVDATFTHADGDINMALHRETSSGLMQVDSSTSTSDNESVSENYTGGGTNYFIEVTGNTSSTQGFRNDYDLTVNVNFNNSCPEDSFGTSGSGNFSKSDAASISVKDYDMADSLMLCENTEDWYKFTPSSSGNAKFGLSQTAALGEINIELRDGSGSTLGTVSKQYNGNIKVAEYSGLSAGTTYYVRVYPKGGRVIRNGYDLWASWSGSTPSEPWCPDLFERNDLQSGGDSAQVVFTDGRSQHPSALACGAEEDWYKLDLVSSATYHLDAFFTHDSDSDLTIEMRDSSGSIVQDDNGNDIAFGTNDSSDDDEQTLFSPGSDGTFYFGVKNKLSGETTNPFQIVEDARYTSGSTAASTCQNNYDDAFEDNDSEGPGIASVGPSLPIGVSAIGCDEDNYKWEPNSDQSITATVYMDNNLVQLQLRLLDASGNELAKDNNVTNPSDNRAQISHSVTGGNIYFLEVQRQTKPGGSSDGNGPYMLRVE